VSDVNVHPLHADAQPVLSRDSLVLLLLISALATIVIRRARNHLNRQKIIEATSQMFAALPSALTPHLGALSCNEPISIYNGMLMLNDESKTFSGSGEVLFLWLPNPRTVIQGEFSEIFQTDALQAPTLRIDGFEPAKVLITSTSIASSHGRLRVYGILNEPLRPRTLEGNSKEIGFLLTNFSSYIGEPVRVSSNSLAMGNRRWLLKSDKYEIAIDLAEQHKEVTESVKVNGRFGVTHIGRLSSKNGTLLSMNDFDTLGDVMRYFLGLCRGFWVGPVLPFVVTDGKPSHLFASFRLTAWQSIESWFPDLKPMEAGKSFNRFHQLFQDPAWAEGLRHAIEWYVDANTAYTLESSIVKAQVGLEHLAWLVLVDRQRKKSSTKYNSDDAAKNLRNLLEQLGIPTAFTMHLSNLRRGTAAWGAANGVHAIVKVRNRIIHSTSSKRRELAILGTMAKLEAKHLGLQYLELSLLAII